MFSFPWNHRLNYFPGCQNTFVDYIQNKNFALALSVLHNVLLCSMNHASLSYFVNAIKYLFRKLCETKIALHGQLTRHRPQLPLL